MAERDIIIIGAGGHARVLIDVLRAMGARPTAAVDANPALHGGELDGVPIIGGDERVFARAAADVVLVNAQGNVPTLTGSGLARRRKVFEKFIERGYTFMSVISPTAVVSPHATISPGAQVLIRAVVNAGARVAANAIVNTGAQLDHDCSLGAHSHVAPGAVLCGGVHIGEECHVGAGAVVIPQTRIGAGATIGAGAAVVADVHAATCVLGVPAKNPRPLDK